MSYLLFLAFIGVLILIWAWVAIRKSRLESRHRLLSEHITRNMPSGLITVNCGGTITGYNPASERTFDSLLAPNSKLTGLVRESGALQDLLNRCLETGETFKRVEFNVPARGGGDRRIGINLSPIIDSRGQIGGAICLLSDLTEIVELQNQIKLKENFAALGEMSAGIAHEFKNSIATILGYAQMSAAESDVAQIQSYAREILKEAQSLSTIVTDFLNFARPVRASIQDVDMVQLLEGIVLELKNLRPGGYTVRLYPARGAVIGGDVTLIKQLFLNLLINAVEALKGAGTITLVVENLPDRDSIRVVVEDSGRGIPEDQLHKIFLPFYTTKALGTGLGLSLVQKIVLAHNGKIEVQSTEGRGTRFILTFPRPR